MLDGRVQADNADIKKPLQLKAKEIFLILSTIFFLSIVHYPYFSCFIYDNFGGFFFVLTTYSRHNNPYKQFF